jgi:hypothetical protein
MIRTYSHKASRLQSILRILLTTDLWWYIVLVFATYVIIMGIWVGFLNAVIPETFDLDRWRSAADWILFLFLPSFYYWVGEGSRGYTQLPTLYKQMCVKIKTMTEKYVCMIDSPTSNGISPDVKIQDATQNVADASVAAAVVAYHSFYAAANERWADDEYLQDIRSQPVLSVIARHKKTHPVTNHVIRDFLKIVVANFKYLEDKRVFRSGDIMIMMEDVNAAINTVGEMEVSNSVVEPTIYRSQHVIVVYFFLLFIFPFAMWARLTVFESMIVYPIVAFIITASSVYRDWLGSPSDPWRPVNLMDFEEWKADCVDSVRSTLSRDHVEDSV